MAQQGWLDGYTAVLTGAGGGIGRAVAERYLAEGAQVVVLDRDEASVAALAEAHPGRAFGVFGDVRDPQAHVDAVALAQERFGGVDVLVANAGVFDFWRPLPRYSLERLERSFDEIFAINVKGHLLAVKAAETALRQSKGAVILTTSVAGLNAAGGGVLYTASKHAVVGLVRQLALELSPDIRVNGVAPGATLTGLSGVDALDEGCRSIQEVGDISAAVSKILPLGFAQQPQDHAGAYVLLASRENARAITGQIIVSDGGQEIRAIG